MIDFTWNLFSQTGNIETYLLLKELEAKKPSDNLVYLVRDESESSQFHEH